VYTPTYKNAAGITSSQIFTITINQEEETS